MNLLMLVDMETLPDGDPDLLSAEPAPTHARMEYDVARGLRAAGHTVEILPFGPSVERSVEALAVRQSDLLINLTEWFKGQRRMDAPIAGLLDLMGLRYTGSGPIGLMLCRDKDACKRILRNQSVRLPHFVTIQPGQKRLTTRMVFPAIVKPLYEDGSDGISQASLVTDAAGLLERVKLIHEQRKQPAICEQFIEGRELYVALVGNQRLRAFPPREVVFGRMDEGGPTIATARVKRDEAYRDKWEIKYVHAELAPELEKRLVRVAKRIFHLLHMRDYGRIDFRLTPQGEIFFLEANPNPNLEMDDEVAESAKKSGMAYPDLLDLIVRQAAQRYR